MPPHGRCTTGSELTRFVIFPQGCGRTLITMTIRCPGQMAQAPFVRPAVIAYVLQGCDPAGSVSDRGRRVEGIESQREG
jgi:hypothetical protein